jgi:hypothetical protein
MIIRKSYGNRGRRFLYSKNNIYNTREALEIIEAEEKIKKLSIRNQGK